MLGPTNLPLLSPTELHLGIGPVAIPTGSPLQAVVDHTGTLVCLVSFRLIPVIRQGLLCDSEVGERRLEECDASTDLDGAVIRSSR